MPDPTHILIMKIFQTAIWKIHGRFLCENTMVLGEGYSVWDGERSIVYRRYVHSMEYASKPGLLLIKMNGSFLETNTWKGSEYDR